MPDSVHQNHNKNPQAATQTYLRIAEIHDDTIVLKNGGLRSVLAVGSVNINLKSEDEQNALAYSYQGFLNSLEFPIQILVRSKKLDISGYLEEMDERGRKQTNQLLKNQTVEYTEYIRRLVEYADIMQKQFFVIVPFDPVRASGKGMLEKFWDYIHPSDSESAFRQRRKEFSNISKGLTERCAQIRTGLENCGLSVRQLETKELISTFYEIYNPETARNEKMEDPSKVNLVTELAAS